MDFLSSVRERVVVFDGAMGTGLQAYDLDADAYGGLSLEGCPEVLCATQPDIIRALHESFFAVGVDIVETNSFGGMPWVLGEYGIADRAMELALASARLAKEVASGYGKLVAGSMGPGTKSLPSLRRLRDDQLPFAEMRDGYQLLAHGLIEGGADLLIIETMQDPLCVKAAMQGARKAMAALGRVVPMQVQVTIETNGRMLAGSEIGAALTAVAPMKPDVFGINCATGPHEMSEHVRHLSRHCPVPISVLPNAGLPSVVNGHVHYDLTPEQLADYHERFVKELGVSVVGGCCGTTPEHLRLVVERVANLTPGSRTPNLEPGGASIYSSVPFAQDTSFLMIGERANANGSKPFREAMVDHDYDTCERIAVEQIKEGAHLLDLCVDYVGTDGVRDMDEIAGRLATSATAPIVLDSTEPPVIEAGLQWLGGRCVLNSVNLEDGDAPGTRLDRFLSMARDYGAAVVCTCIDETGQARTARWKADIAKRITDIAVDRYGLSPGDLLFDPLALTLSTGMEESRRDAIETLEGIRLIKAELPGVFTTLGLSNASFGFKPAIRHVLNSVLLNECVQAGLDSAIVHAGKILPLSRIPQEQVDVCLDLIYDRRDESRDYDPLQTLLAMFENVKSAKTVKEDRSGWPVEERLKRRIIDGEKDGLEAELDEALGGGLSALDIVNDVLLDGMKVVGELFGSGQMQLPFVLQSAETMKRSVAHLEPHMEKSDQGGKGRIVLATVKGDVHDIGKNLVDIILTNNGYEVHNLGIKVAVNEMLEKATEIKADAIGMSGLLVKSTLIMRDNLMELNDRKLSNIPVLLGGAALTRTYVERDLREVYEGRLFYGKDAFEGLSTMDKLMGMKKAGTLDADVEFGITPGGRNLPKREPKAPVDRSTLPARSPEVATDNELFAPPFVGSRVIKGVELDEIATYVNETELYRTEWGFRPEKGEKDDEFKERIRPVFREQLASARAKGVLIPQVVYGFFPANGDGDELVIWKDDDRNAEWMRFSFPRQSEAPFLCIADFYRPMGSGDADYAAFHIVTMGQAVSDEAHRLKEAGDYQDYLFLHGLGVDMTEALAELWHKRIREEWGIVGEDGPSVGGLFRQQYRGGRYSWGYPACPDLEDNAKVAELLGADRIGVELSESFQFVPEQTTSAIISHHPRAKYFVAR